MNAERRKTAVTVGAMIFAWLIPVAGIFVMSAVWAQTEEKSIAVPLPAVIEVGKRTVDERVAVELHVDVEAPEQLRTRVGGTLTTLNLGVGTDLKLGEVAFSIDGIDVLVHRSSVPFYRELAVGAKGPDVLAYGQLLSELSLLSNPDDLFGPKFDVATRALQRLIHAPVDGVFRPEYTVYASPDAARVAATPAQVGARVEPGDTLASLTPGISVGMFRASESGQMPAFAANSQIRVEVGDETIDISDPQNLNAVTLLKVIGTVEKAAASGSYPKAAISDSDGTRVYAQLFLQLAEPEEYGALPSGAIITTPQGATCVLVEGDVTSVAIVPSPELGVAFISAEYVGLSVSTRPSLEERRKCE